jgi:16S rRNA (cytosine1402-N4)-methyltransferase
MGEPRGIHVPVLLARCLELLAPALDPAGRPAVHLDATLGLGGHAEAVLAAHPHAVLVGLDRDPEALRHARHRLARYADRTHLMHAVYDDLPAVLDELGRTASTALFDLGVSSLQIDADRASPMPGRAAGHADGPDQRCHGREVSTPTTPGSGPDPAGIRRGAVRRPDRDRDRQARASRITSSARLAELVRASGGRQAPVGTRQAHVPGAAHRGQPRLSTLERGCAALDALAVGGQTVVLSYHSLEDRIVKQR